MRRHGTILTPPRGAKGLWGCVRHLKGHRLGEQVTQGVEHCLKLFLNNSSFLLLPTHCVEDTMGSLPKSSASIILHGETMKRFLDD